MKVTGIDHVAIAAEDVDEAAALFEDLLGLRFGDRIEYTTETTAGEHRLAGRLSYGLEGFDLVQPREDDNAVGDFLDRNGPGLYAVAFRVRDVDAALSELAGKGVEPIGYISNAEFTEYFLHPDDFGGMLVILAERPHPFETNHKIEAGAFTEYEGNG